MSEKQTGGYAFPSEQGHIPDGTWNQTYDPGMTLRDYFAAKAMQSWITGMLTTAVNAKVELAGIDSPATVAEFSYRMADVMIEERKK